MPSVRVEEQCHCVWRRAGEGALVSWERREH